jgi:hypothetical protein
MHESPDQEESEGRFFIGRGWPARQEITVVPASDPKKLRRARRSIREEFGDCAIKIRGETIMKHQKDASPGPERLGITTHEEFGFGLINDYSLKRILLAEDAADPPVGTPKDPESAASRMIAKAKRDEAERLRLIAIENAKSPEQKAHEAAAKKREADLKGYMRKRDKGKLIPTHQLEHDFDLLPNLRPIEEWGSAEEALAYSDNSFAISPKAQQVIRYLRSGRVITDNRKVINYCTTRPPHNLISGVEFSKDSLCCPNEKWIYPAYWWDYIQTNSIRPPEELILDAMAWGG